MANSVRASLDPAPGRGPGRDLTILGGGRAATHLAHYFERAGFLVARWTRSHPEAPHEQQAAELELLTAGERTTWLLLSDDALVPFLDRFPFLRSRRLVHASGSLVIPEVLGAHPLMTFGPKLAPLASYREMAFVLDRPQEEFRAFMPGLENPVYSIRPEDRARYHALCVLAGNFTTLLWSKLFRDFEARLGIPAEAAKPYLERVCENLVRSPNAALTGPLARGDAQTIARNLASLEGDAYEGVYRAFIAAYAAERETSGSRLPWELFQERSPQP